MAITARHLVPKQGLDHPAFAELPEGDHLIAHLLFVKTQDDAQQEKTQELQEDWLAMVDWARFGGPPVFHDWTTSRGDVWLRISGVRQPREPINRLIEHLQGLGLQMHEVFLARWTVLDAENELMGPVTEPGGTRDGRDEFEDSDVYMRELLDPESEPIASEHDLALKGILFDKGEVSALEYRGHVLHLPQARIGYGIQTSYEPIPGDARTDQVEAAVAAAIKREFETAWAYFAEEPFIPEFGNFAREGGHVDTIVAQGRRGYELSVPAIGMQLKVRDAFRQREYEMMNALSAVIRELDLEPVVMWMRLGSPPPGPQLPGIGYVKTPVKYFFQLWEKPGHAEVPQVSKREDLTWPPETADSVLVDWLANVGGHAQFVRARRTLRADLEANLGARLAADVAQFLAVREKRTFSNRVIGPLEMDDGDVVMPDASKGNLAEAMFWRPYGTILQGLMMGAVPIGYVRGTDYTAFATTEGERAIVFGASPQQGGQTMADGLSAFLTMCQAMGRQTSCRSSHQDWA